MSSYFRTEEVIENDAFNNSMGWWHNNDNPYEMDEWIDYEYHSLYELYGIPENESEEEEEDNDDEDDTTNYLKINPYSIENCSVLSLR